MFLMSDMLQLVVIQLRMSYIFNRDKLKSFLQKSALCALRTLRLCVEITVYMSETF